MADPGEARIIVAIDFGTTCSSIAYVFTNEIHPEHKLIREWPNASQTSDDAPTIIKYDDTTPTSPYRWGYQVEEEELRHEWFKLGLSPNLLNSGLAFQYPSRNALAFATGAACEKMVTDYLRGLREHTEEFLEEKFSKDIMSNNVPHYIITVPAVWSDKARATTRSCAEKAGMGNKYDIQIITEPEAAGIYALKNMKLPLKVNDTFVMCDAGGGTVDLISYTVIAVGDKPVISESAPGTGGICGSTILNRIFDQRLRNKFSSFPKWDEGYHRDAMNRFETIKKEYSGDKKKKFKIPARGLSDNTLLGIKSNQVEVSGKELEEVFEPVVSEILSLVTAQIKSTTKPVKKVLLAGGFGQSKYLLERIKKEVGQVEVIRIEDGATAIVRGALLRGIAEKSPGRLGNINVDGRIAIRHYGTLAWVPYDAKLHSESHLDKREKGGSGGVTRVEVMEWMISKGTLVRESKSVSFHFYWDRNVLEGRPTIILLALYKCDDLQNRGASKYYDEREVQKLMDLKADVTSIPEYKFKREVGTTGVAYYKLHLKIEMTYQSGSFQFTLLCDGVRYDTVEQVFE